MIQEALSTHYKDHQMALQGDVFLEKIVQVGPFTNTQKCQKFVLLGAVNCRGQPWIAEL